MLVGIVIAEGECNGEFADAVIARVCDEQGACGADPQAARGVEAHREAAAGFEIEASGTGAADALDQAGGQVEQANAVVVRIRDEKMPAIIDGNALWPVELGARAQVPISGKSGGAGSRKGGDDARGIDLANAVVVRIRDIHIVLCVNGKGMGPVEAGACGRAVVAGISPLIRTATAGKGGDDARGIDLANAVVVRIRDIHIASLIDSETGGASEVGVGCASPVPAKLPDARACKRGQRAIAYLPHHMGLGFADDQRVALEDQGGRRGEFPICGCREGLDDARFDLANAIVARIRDVNIAAGIRCDAVRILEERVCCRAAIAGKSAGLIPRTAIVRMVRASSAKGWTSSISTRPGASPWLSAMMTTRPGSWPAR